MSLSSLILKRNIHRIKENINLNNNNNNIKNCLNCIYNKNNYCVKFDNDNGLKKNTIEYSRNNENLCGVNGKYFEEYYKLSKKDFYNIENKITDTNEKVSFLYYGFVIPIGCVLIYNISCIIMLI